MKLVGITGGIGMGKSTAMRFLESWGVPALDTDVIARQLVEPGQPALSEIVKAFGPQILDENGKLLRGELAKIVFGNAVARATLEGILHPRIRENWIQEAERWRAQSHKLGVVVIPLLYETNAVPFFDAIVALACSRNTQESRLRERGWSKEEIERRRNAQWPVEKKVQLADHVVWTEGNLDVHAEQLQKIVNRCLLPA